ncbi:putative transposase [Erwinia toletana]|uniref:Transposase n=1 Tax=Winslowiella toletana TaxID=92490 RepID=A0ABS4P907_9GAMM|nr:HigA family addiction module antitoxin [Winslowiella toletana]MBP2168418.1 putative transposase [Winslowiella toletana]
MDTTTAEPTSVGEMLVEEFLKPLNITQQQLAESMGVSRKVISQIVNGTRRISVTEAAQLSALFEMSSDFWLNVQAAHDRWEARMLSEQKKWSPINLAFAAIPGI